jgi:hypothetical protein
VVPMWTRWVAGWVGPFILTVASLYFVNKVRPLRWPVRWGSCHRGSFSLWCLTRAGLGWAGLTVVHGVHAVDRGY